MADKTQLRSRLAAGATICALLIASANSDAGARTSQRRKSAAPKPTTHAGVKATTAPTAGLSSGACANTVIKVMPLGDSLTGFPDSYRGPLYRALKQKHFNIDFVGSISQPPTGGGDPDSNGWGGYRIGPDVIKDFNGAPADLADHLAEWFKANPPDVVLLMIGTNDLAAGGEVTRAAPAKLKALIERAQQLAPNADLLVGDVPPYAAQFDGSPDQNAINKAGEAAAASPDDLILHVPVFKRLHDTIDTDKDYVDGIHFTPSGGEKLAFAWLPELDLVLTRRTLTCH